MPLVALKELRYAGRTILAGETFEAVSPQDARTLVKIGRAKQAEATKEAETKPESEETKREETKSEVGTYRRQQQHYKTRHMKAEDK